MHTNTNNTSLPHGPNWLTGILLLVLYCTVLCCAVHYCIHHYCISERRDKLDRAYVEAEDLSGRIDANLAKKSGLCIRVLDRASLAHVLQYLDVRVDRPAATCKYWRAVVQGNQQQQKKKEQERQQQ